MENKKNTVNIPLIIIILIFIVVLVAVLIAFNSKNNTGATNNVNTAVDTVNTSNVDNVIETTIGIKNIASWNGIYNGIDGKSLRIWRINDNKVGFTIDAGGEGMAFYYEAEITQEDIITYTTIQFDNTINIKMKKSSNTIELSSSSTEQESELNTTSGTYTKEETEEIGWNGKYINGNDVIFLAEVLPESIYMTYHDSSEGIMSADYGDSFTQYNETKMTLEKEAFGGVTKIEIEKTSEGIKVKASSTEEGMEYINNMSGKEFKKVQE